MSSKQPIHLSADREPWDRQNGESNRQYSRFQTFDGLDRTRDLKQAAQMLRDFNDTVSYRTLMQYAYEYRWTERAEAHDRAKDQLEAARLLLLRREMYSRHRRMASGLLAKGVAALAQIKPEDMTAFDTLRFIRYGIEIEAKALGEPTQITQVVGPGGGPIQIDDLSRLDPEQRRDRQLALSAELARRAQSAAVTDDDD